MIIFFCFNRHLISYWLRKKLIIFDKKYGQYWIFNFKNFKIFRLWDYLLYYKCNRIHLSTEFSGYSLKFYIRYFHTTSCSTNWLRKWQQNWNASPFTHTSNHGRLKFRTSRPDQFEKILIIYKLKVIFEITIYFQVRHKVSHLINF